MTDRRDDLAHAQNDRRYFSQVHWQRKPRTSIPSFIIGVKGQAHCVTELAANGVLFDLLTMATTNPGRCYYYARSNNVRKRFRTLGRVWPKKALGWFDRLHLYEALGDSVAASARECSEPVSGRGPRAVQKSMSR
jgi:hypothetical protein